MDYTREDVFTTAPNRLARMLELLDGDGGEWQLQDLGAILRHQLAAPIETGKSSGRNSLPQRKILNSEPVRTLADLYHHASPPLELLEAAKNFAKANREHFDSPLPPEVATVLYYASILAALLRHGRKITRLDEDALREGIQWVLLQGWVDEQTRQLFREGLRHLNGGLQQV